MPVVLRVLVTIAACVLGSATRAAAVDPPSTDLARRMVFEVSVQYPGVQVGRLVQPGFLVAEGGVGVTSYNALHGATAARAVFAGDPGSYEVVILRAEPSRDLALVRLKPADEDTPALERYLPIAPGDLRDRQPVWTLKSSVVLDETKAAAGMVEVSSQNVGRNPGLAFDAPGWIGADVYQDRHTSGCPLVDERGRLVGLQVWSWPGEATRPVGLTARAIDDLLLAYADDCKKARDRDQPEPSIAVSDARRVYQGKVLIGSVFPRMSWGSVAASRADGPNAEAKRLADNLKCSACSGSGRVPAKGGTPSRTGGVPGRASRQETCSACDGQRFLPPDRFEGVVARAARAIAAVPHGTDAHDALLGSLAEGAAASSAIDARTFASRLNDITRKQFDPSRLRRGDAVMFVGTLSRDRHLSAWDRNVAIINPGWDAKTRILAISHDDGGSLDRAQQALIVGVVSGIVTARPIPHVGAQTCVVLDRVTAVPLRTTPR